MLSEAKAVEEAHAAELAALHDALATSRESEARHRAELAALSELLVG